MHTAAAVTFNGGEKVTEIPRGMSAVSSVQLAVEATRGFSSTFSRGSNEKIYYPHYD